MFPDISIEGPAALILGGLTFLVLAATGRLKNRPLPGWLRWTVGTVSVLCILLGLLKGLLEVLP
jgi:hypothetical protein